MYWRFISLSIFFFLLGYVKAQEAELPTINPKGIQIIRDTFGVPHIFAKTDAEVAYGLAWANAEDAFLQTQDLIYTAKGFMGRKDGINGVKVDYFVHAIGAKKIVEERFNLDLHPAFRKYINGYMQGLNAFAKAHPEQVKIKKAFPVNEKDLLAAYVIIMSYLSSAQSAVSDAVAGNWDKDSVLFKPYFPPVGSNAYAMSPAKSADGKTYLCINPHLAMDGPFSFYESHLQSEEGLAFAGCMFQGSTSHAMGANSHLGWGFTWNYFDKLDYYRLKMHPHKKHYYELDGQWKKLVSRPVWLKVKIKGMVIPVRKVTYWSDYGMTLLSSKSKNFYSIRFAANQNIKSAQQLYEMAKSTDYNQFWNALRSNHAISLFNMVYADSRNNIFYLSHGQMPDRKNQTYEWDKLLPGNTSETLWKNLVPLDSMPHVINPRCGYVFNTNNNVYSATCEGENDRPSRLPKYVNERPGDNNRAETLKEFFASHERISYDQFRDIKFETKFPRHGNFWQSVQPLLKINEQAYPDIAEFIQDIKKWDWDTQKESYGTTLFGVFLHHIWEKRHYGDEQFVTGFKLTDEDIVEACRGGQKLLMENFGTIHLPWGDVNKLRRGDKVYPMGSFADLLSPCYSQPHKINGKLEFNPAYGDTYTMFVKYGNNGLENMETLQPLGNSIDPKNPHYNDQMENFLAKKLKKQILDKSYWEQNGKRNYHPE